MKQNKLFARIIDVIFDNPYLTEQKDSVIEVQKCSTVKLVNKERFDKEQIGFKEPFPVTNLPFTS